MLTRLWIILLSLTLGAAAATALLLPRPIAADREHEAGIRLERAQQAASLFLKVNARNWMDSAARVTGDAVLMESLDQATRGPADLGLVHRTVQERLRAFRESTKVDLILATDGHGRVIARAGLDEAVYKDGVEGFPLVADALRGLRGDDTWSLGGKLYRVVASPVVAHERYAGAIVMGQEAGDELAQSMKQLFGVEVAFLLRGRVLASSSALPVVAQLPVILQRETSGGALPVEAEGDRFLVITAPFVGEAAGHQAAYALLLARPPAPSLRGLVDTLIETDPKVLLGRDLAPIGAAAATAILVGLVLFWMEARRPLRRLADETQALARGEVGRLDDRLHPGQLGRVARAVNTTLDRLGSVGRPPSRPNPPSLTPEPVVHAPPAPDDHAPPPVALDEAADAPSYDSAPAGESPLLGSIADQPQASHPDYVAMPAALRSPLQIAPNGPAALAPTLPQGADNFDQEDRTVATTVPPVEEAEEAEPVEQDPLEIELRSVFSQFLETKQRCGEPVDGVTYDKFAQKLRINRSQLMTRFSCREVRFQVYIKDGKAALKATPITS